MASILKLKKLFNLQKEVLPSYKYSHYLTRMPMEKIGEMLIYSESDALFSLMPEIGEKKALVINDGLHKYLFKKMSVINAQFLVNFCVSREVGIETQAPFFSLFGDLEKMPFRNLFFDLIICPFSAVGNRFSVELIKNLSRSLKNGGRLLLSVRHPQFEHVIFNQNQAEIAATSSGVSTYFSLLRAANLYTEEVHEGCVGQNHKPYFNVAGQGDYYQDYKGLPLTLLFKAVKYEAVKKP